MSMNCLNTMKALSVNTRHFEYYEEQWIERWQCSVNIQMKKAINDLQVIEISDWKLSLRHFLFNSLGF